MTIQVTCDSCFMNYQLKDELAGRKVRCKQCKEIIEVPRPGAKRVGPAEDPWMEEDDEPAEAPRAPAPARKKKKKRKKARSESSSGFRFGVIAILGIVFAGLFVLMCLVGFLVPTVHAVLGGGTALVGGGLMLIGAIGVMMAAFEEDVMCGVMYLLVPFYPLYFIITRFGEVWKLLATYVGGVALLVVGMMMYSMSLRDTGGGRGGGDGGGQPFDFSNLGAQDEDSLANLREIGLGMHNHHDTFSQLPPAPMPAGGSELQVTMSWQTALLPYVDHALLSNNYKRDAPWDDPANEPVTRKLVDPYLQPAIDETNDARGFGLSHYALNQALLGPKGGLAIREIRDGTANTAMSGEVGGGYKPWADPSNVRAVGGSLTPGPATFGNPSGQGAYMLMADGSVKWLSSDVDPSVLNAIGTPDGGELVDF